MHRTIGYLSERIAHIRPGEGRKVTLTFLYFFLVITAYYVIKPVSRSLVLDELGSRLVPYADLICAILMGPIVTLFARLVDRVEKPQLVSVSFLTVSGVLLVFWVLLLKPHPWLAGAFYIWVAIFSVLVVTLFWLVANDLYQPRDAKRLFGFIGSGGILGGITGSAIAAAGAQLIGTSNLLLLSAGLLLLCWVIVRKLWAFSPDTTGEPNKPTQRHETFLSNLSGFIQLLSRSRYLLFLITVVGVNKVVATLIYYQFNPFIEQTFTSLDAKTTFNGLFSGGINLLAFVVQFCFTSWILRRWGLLVALLVLPLGLVVGNVSLLIIPLFSLAAATEFYDASLNYSLNNTAKEVLYLPIDRSIRYKVKPFIDMVVFRFGKALAAILGIVLLDWLNFPVGILNVLITPLLVVWIVVALRVRREYTMTIRTILQAKTDAAKSSAESPARSQQPTRFVSESSGSLMTRRSAHHKLSLISRLVGMADATSEEAQKLLANLAKYEESAQARASSSAITSIHQLRSIVQDPSKPLSQRIQAVHSLARQTDQGIFDYLCGVVLVEDESLLRHEVVRVLVKMRLSHPSFQVPAAQLRRQVAREVHHFQRIAKVGAIYRRQHQGPVTADDPVIALLRSLLEDACDQIFRFLMLIYRPEDIQLVYEQLRASDTYLRTDAIELLDNLIDPAMRMSLFSILDEDGFLSILDDKKIEVCEPTVAYQILQEAIWDHDPWLSVTTLCAIGRLRLAIMRQELEQATRHSMSLISTAAKVALHLASVR